MSSTVTASRDAGVPRRHALAPFPLAFGAAFVLALAVMAPQAVSVWTRGTFLDPDDALRTVEIRDFLAGQGWFDMVPHRLAPGHPFPMHWSRLVDAPLAALDRLFETVLRPDAAERAVRIAAPLLFFAGALGSLLRLVRTLAGPRAVLPAALLLASSTELVANFLPGHIHHHGLQAMLLLVATAALLGSAMPDGRPREAGVAGLAAVLSLGVGLQNLPFVVGLVAIALLLWVARGQDQAARLTAFGFGLMGAVPVFLLDVPPDHYGDGACDAFSAAHLLAAAGSGVLCFGLAAASRRLPGRPARFAAGAAGALIVVAPIAVCFPQCLKDPMAGVDPLLRQAWLSGVGEALPLWRLVALSWPEGMSLLLTLLCGLGATALAAMAAPQHQRAAWCGLLLLCGIGFAGSLWQVRVAASTCALLVPGAAWAVLRLHDRVRGRPGAPALLIATMAGALLGGTGWTALAVPLARHARGAGPASNPAACFDPAAFADLAALPPGLVLSTIDPGSAILAYTPHTVLAAPYHRNGYGNRVSLLALAASPDDARPMIRDAGVRYLALCRTSNETAETVAEHPESLSAALLAGRVPDWLTSVSRRDMPFLLFRVD